jgi:4-carboxymuconolactone decarboxylase
VHADLTTLSLPARWSKLGFPLRPDLAPNNENLVPVSARVTNGQIAQIPYHLNRATDNELIEEYASDVLTQLAFCAARPNDFSMKSVFGDAIPMRP